jgi:hypothetical protein
LVTRDALLRKGSVRSEAVRPWGIGLEGGEDQQGPSGDHQRAADRRHSAHDRQAQQPDHGQGQAEDQSARAGQPSGQAQQSARAEQRQGGGQDGVHHLIVTARGQQGFDGGCGAVSGEGAQSDSHGAVETGESEQFAVRAHV